MSVLVGSNVSKSFGAFDVFTDLNFSVARGDKVALIGVNGCGKTTLLRIVAGADDPNIGSEIRFARGVTRGYLSQTAEDSDESTVWQHAQDAFAELHAIQQRMAKLEEDMLDPAKADRALEQYGVAQHEFELKGGYEMDAKIKRVLGGLGFKDDDVHKPLSQLSGGQRVRAALAQLLLQSPDVLLLDEPTNHLDRQGVEWLENFLQDWEGTLIVVSHDRYFLDEVCDQVWEMGRRRDGQSHIEIYRGGYTEYVQQRTERRERAMLEFEAQQEFIKKQEEFIRRNMAGQNTAQAKGRLRRLNRLERLEKPVEQRAMSIRIKGGSRSGDRVLETSGLHVGYQIENEELIMKNDTILNSQFAIPQSPAPSHLLFKSPDLLLLRTERAALIGPNGTGKTTFLKTIMGETPALKGEVKLGANVHVGYFAQAHEGLDPEHTVLQELMSARDDLKLSEARDILGRFLFSGDDQFKKVGMLSGGERGRVALAKLTLQGANFLLLDEPTNHLDIPSQEVLTEALNHFDGTLLMVSHDRYLIAALATQLWILDRDAKGQTALTVFKGTYDAWRDSLDEAARAKAESAAQKAASNGQKQPEPKKSEPAQASPASSQTAESKNRQQQRIAKMAAAEKRIEDLEHKLHELNWQMESAGSDFAKIQTLSAEYAKTESELADAWAEFEKIA
jgi:ATP-binding cassette subfamily F protein 3